MTAKCSTPLAPQIDGSIQIRSYLSCCEVTETFNISAPQIDGSIQIRSYLSENPPIKIKLNDDMVIGRRDSPYGGSAYGETSGSVILDDCNFHESANLEKFDIDRCGGCRVAKRSTC